MDLDDLLDTTQVAALMGITRGHDAIPIYRTRYEDFPVPALERGRCRLWLRQDIENFLERHPGIGRRRRKADESEG